MTRVCPCLMWTLSWLRRQMGGLEIRITVQGGANQLRSLESLRHWHSKHRSCEYVWGMALVGPEKVVQFPC